MSALFYHSKRWLITLHVHICARDKAIDSVVFVLVIYKKSPDLNMYAPE